MYANLFFLILMLLLVDLGPQLSRADIDPGTYLHTSLILAAFYLFMLALIVFQNRYFNRLVKRFPGRMLAFVNVELIAFISAAYFYFDLPVLIKSIPWIGHSKLIALLIPFGAYLLGLFAFHFSLKLRQYAPTKTAIKKSCLELRLLVPFLIPIVLLTLFREGMRIYSYFDLPMIPKLFLGENAELIFSLLSAITFLGIVMVLLPPLMIWIWQCEPLEEGPLLNRLEALCQKAGVKHAGIMVWKPLENSITAAVIGMIPGFRYLLFTPRMLAEMSPEQIEVVLCHELGHCYRKHLYLYPFILAGMAISATLLLEILYNAILPEFKLSPDHGSFWPSMIVPMGTFLLFAVVFWLYFRYIFGFFSRLFERQADLHVFHLGLNPDDLIGSFYHMGEATAQGLTQPSWHHYSLKERIDFIEKVKQNPEELVRHHRRVKRMLFLYFILLVIMAGGLYLI